MKNKSILHKAKNALYDLLINKIKSNPHKINNNITVLQSKVTLTFA